MSQARSVIVQLSYLKPLVSIIEASRNSIITAGVRAAYEVVFSTASLSILESEKAAICWSSTGQLRELRCGRTCRGCSPSPSGWAGRSRPSTQPAPRSRRRGEQQSAEREQVGDDGQAVIAGRRQPSQDGYPDSQRDDDEQGRVDGGHGPLPDLASRQPVSHGLMLVPRPVSFVSWNDVVLEVRPARLSC